MSVRTQLLQLESSGLIELASLQPEIEYLFRHALVQEAAYDSLLRQDRRELHRSVGETLERTYADRLDELAPVLAQHFDAAGEENRALAYYTRAGNVAAARYANAEAVMHYTRAIELGRDSAQTEELCHLFTARGRALELSGQYAEALSSYHELEELATKRGDAAMELAGWVARLTVYAAPTSAGDPAQGEALAERALARARALGDRRAESRVLWSLMLFHEFGGRLDEGIAAGEQSLAIARELDLREQIAYVQNDVHTVYLLTGRIDQARTALLEAQTLWRELGNQPMLTDSLIGLAFLHYLLGQHAEAISLADEAHGLSESIGNLWGQSYSLHALVPLYLDQAELGRAVEVMEECIRLAELAGFMVPLIQTRVELALTYGTLGVPERGLELARIALARTDSLPPSWRLFPLSAIARLQLQCGDLAAAQRTLEEYDAFRGEGDLHPVIGLLRSLSDAELAVERQEFARVVAALDEGLEPLRQVPGRPFLARALSLRGTALAGLGRVDEARAVLEEARAVAESIDSRRVLWPTFIALADLAGRRGETDEADRLRDEARKIVHHIAERIPEPALRASFLNTPAARAAL